jgi:hypothetical protein
MDDDEVGDGCNGVDEDDAKGSKIQATVWWTPLASSPSRFLLEARFHGFLASLRLWFEIHLHMVDMLDGCDHTPGR